MSGAGDKRLEERARDLAERVRPHLPEQRVLALLDSPSADDRREGIRIAGQEAVEAAIPRLTELLDDDTPYIFQRGERRFVSEVRIDALLSLEDIYRLARRPIDFGLVSIRRAMPASETVVAAERALAEVDAPRREQVLHEVDEALGSRLEPGRDGDDALRAYRVLQALGRIDYHRQAVDPTTYLTPLQTELYGDQVRTPPSPPYLRVAPQNEPTRTLGYLYREGSSWRQRFAESTEAETAQRYLAKVLSIESDGVPRVDHDDAGNPRTHDDGSLVLSGVIPSDTDDTVAFLDSAAAFVQRRYEARVIASALAPADASTPKPKTFVRYLFVWDPRTRRVVDSYYIRRGDRPDQVATDTAGGPIPPDEELERLAELRKRYPTDRYTYGGGWAPSLEASVKGFFALQKDYD